MENRKTTSTAPALHVQTRRGCAGRLDLGWLCGIQNAAWDSFPHKTIIGTDTDSRQRQDRRPCLLPSSRRLSAPLSEGLQAADSEQLSCQSMLINAIHIEAHPCRAADQSGNAKTPKYFSRVASSRRYSRRERGWMLILYLDRTA